MAALVWLVRQPAVPLSGVRCVIALNALWVLGSAAALFAFSPSALGYAFGIAQAAAVGALAELQAVGLRGLRRPA